MCVTFIMFFTQEVPTLTILYAADVNSGINTRLKLRRHDPQLALLLEHAFGDGDWRYQNTSPAKFFPYGTSCIPR